MKLKYETVSFSGVQVHIPRCTIVYGIAAGIKGHYLYFPAARLVVSHGRPQMAYRLFFARRCIERHRSPIQSLAHYVVVNVTVLYKLWGRFIHE